MIKCIVIEDEPLAAEKLKDYISRLPDLQLMKWFDDGDAAVNYLKENDIDLIFLDLHLGESSGITLMEEGAIQGRIIVTTAYSQYALKGYELNVADYLLKPFVFDRFEAAVRKALRKQSGEELYVMIKSEYKLEKVFLSDILYIEGMGDYRRIHTTSRRVMTLQTFRELETLIPQTHIKRIHKSYMVNLNFVERIATDSVSLKNKMELPVSDSYRKGLSI
jgi:two-component system, LytTR family, response regulator